ncbi:MAG: TIGR03790 family protein [Verrucomicrobiota bacterium]
MVIRLAVIALTSFFCAFSSSAITAENVLVVYNSEEPDSLEVFNYYTNARPGVLSLDLNDSSLLPGTVSYSDFGSKIRDPIRAHLNENDLSEDVMVIVLTKGIPHRIQDLDLENPNLGDSPQQASAAYSDRNLTYASVDSELIFLQFDLDEGEQGGEMDSPADRAIYNPYFEETAPFSSFDRTDIKSDSSDFFQRDTTYNWWRGYETLQFRVSAIEIPMDAGHIYLTARLDGETADDVKAMIDQAASITIRKQTDALLFDADGRSDPLQDDRYPLDITFTPVDDYGEVDTLFSGEWSRVIVDRTGSFLIGETNTVTFTPVTATTGPVAHLNSYGVNHSGSGERQYLSSFANQLVPGASFAAYESYGAAGLGGVTPPINQAQVEEWITAGGTFATGTVWEPFTFGISRSVIFLDGFFNHGLTYVEAAWSSIMQVSWQSVVLGDPLATATIIDAEPYYVWTLAELGTTPTVNSNAAEDADFESDRVPNGVEYGLDLNPAEFTSAIVEVSTGLSEQGPITLSFLLPETVPADVQIEVEANSGLESDGWSSVALRDTSGIWSGTALVEESVVAGGTLVQVTPPFSEEVDESGFFRLSIEIL